ncbi:MAG: DUF6691 family protein [Bacteroidota bacterium]
MVYFIVLMLGILFGLILTNGEVIAWLRIQEMFRFDSFHMYGVIGSAIVVGALSMAVLRKLNLKTLSGDPIVVEEKSLGKGTVIGGLLFGMGWALTGACPGPLYALVGNGYGAFLVALLSAIAGAYVYGSVRDRLPQ